MFHLPLPVLEKLLRPVMVYVVLILLLRLFGKRELAQLNPFDLVVLLSLSNTVQNAIIGDDNSVTGGIIGALGLLTINWLVTRTFFKHQKFARMLAGGSTVLIRDGKVDPKAMKHESLTDEELVEVIHRQGFERLSQIRRCEIEPNGSFYIEAMEPSPVERQHGELVAKIDALTREVAALRTAGSGG
ncbi:MAG TPA: YetF domain-containing protein [Terracidiphilus sp.]